MLPSDRLTFSGIANRKALQFPNGERVVVWPVLALEHWDINRPHGKDGDFTTTRYSSATRSSKLELA